MTQKLFHGKYRYEESHKVEWKHYANEIGYCICHCNSRCTTIIFWLGCVVKVKNCQEKKDEVELMCGKKGNTSSKQVFFNMCIIFACAVHYWSLLVRSTNDLWNKQINKQPHDYPKKCNYLWAFGNGYNMQFAPAGARQTLFLLNSQTRVRVFFSFQASDEGIQLRPNRTEVEERVATLKEHY